MPQSSGERFRPRSLDILLVINQSPPRVCRCPYDCSVRGLNGKTVHQIWLFRRCPRNGRRRYGSLQPLCFKTWEGDPSLAMSNCSSQARRPASSFIHLCIRGGRRLVSTASPANPVPESASQLRPKRRTRMAPCGTTKRVRVRTYWKKQWPYSALKPLQAWSLQHYLH